MASTPRPLIWKNSTPISTGVENNPVKSIQFEDGNADIIYQKNKSLTYKHASISQGHWESMTLGGEITPQVLKLKEIEITQPVSDMVYTLTVRLSNRPFLTVKDLDTGIETEQVITCIS